jgi:CsoR family transcriptional regulator, copper-sensing transcriptional repressor
MTDSAMQTPEPSQTPHHHHHGGDAAQKAKVIARLRKIEGQVRGLQKMVDEDRYCPDILTQISSVQQALRGVSKTLMRDHLRHCTTKAVRESDEAAEQVYEELIDLVYTHAR